MVAPVVRAKIRAVARARGLTLRALVLSALRDSGVLTDLADADFADRRAVIATAKAQLWRERAMVPKDGPIDPDALLAIPKLVEEGGAS